MIESFPCVDPIIQAIIVHRPRLYFLLIVVRFNCQTLFHTCKVL